jgi:hypothetical protein
MFEVTSLPPGYFGWTPNPGEVDRIVKDLPMPHFDVVISDGQISKADENKDVFLYDYFRKVTGKDAPKGPQQIGDCVSWGWTCFGDYLQVVEILDLIHKAGEINEFLEKGWNANSTLQDMKNSKAFQYEELCSEAMYGYSRVEIGQQHGSYQDGSVGAWAAKAATIYGYLTRTISGPYDPQRAKKWGAQGVPDEYEPETKKHLCKVVSKVTSFTQAAAAIQALQGVPVCSNRGFTMSRDAQGFCSPQGTWNHCMCFIGVRWDRPGLLCAQSWGPNTPSGTTYKDQPDNTFWVDAEVADRMLSQDDSFTGNTLEGYANRDYVDLSF